MRKIYLILILLSFVNCKDHNKEEKVGQAEPPLKAEVIKRNEIYIQLEDSSKSFSTNLRLDEFQDRPDLVEIGKHTGSKSFTIPTESEIEMLGGNMAASYQYKLKIAKGDSVKIDLENVKLNDQNEITIPVFQISNSNRKWSELNFGNLLYKKNLDTKAIGIDITKSFLYTYWDSEKIYENAISLLDSLKSVNKISEAFYLEEKDNQKYSFALKKLREEKLQEQESEDLLVIGDQQIPLDKEIHASNAAYISLLRQVIDEKYFGSKREPNSVKFDFVLSNPTFLSNGLKIVVLDSYLKSIFFVEKNKFPVYLEKFNKVSSDPQLQNKWSNVLKDLENNRKKLNTTNRNVATLLNLVNDNQLSFEEILNKHKGKIVLVDFWASWCAPCIKEMPYMKKVKSKFDNNRLQVIEISIDKDYAAWERASRLLGLDEAEESYIITNWEESNLHKNYSVKTIPRYLLFDQKGKIINEDAPRPSSVKLEELIKASI